MLLASGLHSSQSASDIVADRQQIKARLPRAQVVVCGNPAFAAVAGGQTSNTPGAPQPTNISQLGPGGAYEFVDLFIPCAAGNASLSAPICLAPFLTFRPCLVRLDVSLSFGKLRGPM